MCRDALPQASGEALYASDLGVGSGQLYAATVATTQAAARIVSVDASAAEQASPGALRFWLCWPCVIAAAVMLAGAAAWLLVRLCVCAHQYALEHRSQHGPALALHYDGFLISLPGPQQVPGFVAFINAADIPDGGSRDVFGDALFATDFAAYAGQRIGLAVAHSQVSNFRPPHQCLPMCCSEACKQAASPGI